MQEIPNAVIRGIVTHFPSGLITNEALAAQFPEWQVDKIAEKTGINTRHRVADDESALDLAEAAVRKLLAEGPIPLAGCAAGPIDPASIDALLYCTQSPDYVMPTNACFLQHRLGLPTTVMALDYNLGCSGYVYGLALAKGLIASGQIRRALLVTADVITRYIADDDRSVRTLFGDAATATLIEAGDDDASGGHIGAAIYGTDGGGAANIVVTGAGLDGRPLDQRSAGRRPGPTLFMDGPEVFAFSLVAVPKALAALYERAGIDANGIDRFIFHQANRYMLEHLRRKLNIPAERFIIEIADVGNTISSTIPIALARSYRDGRVQAGQRLALVGFGVGFSWGAVVVDWK